MSASLPIKKLAVLGSTGSIGRQTLDIVRTFPGKFKVVALAAGDNLELLQKQLDEFKPAMVYHLGEKGGLNYGNAGFVPIDEIACHPGVDLVVVATAGRAGLGPTLAALKADKTVALSNKEPLVMAGEIIRTALKKSRGCLIPVDSEHSAIWQCLAGEVTRPARIILTASGGPFLRFTRECLREVTVEQALRHPSWSMGKKVTIDSATLMNKGLEVIEAHWLFNIAYENIDVLLHPQSIVHSMIELEDGVIKAQMSYPDMRFPIQFALTYPERLPNPGLPRIDLGKIGNLIFEKPDPELFPCLKIAIQAGRRGGTYPAVLCAADEIAVEQFLKKQIRFTDIPAIVGQVLDRHSGIELANLEEVLAADRWGRRTALNVCGGVRS